MGLSGSIQTAVDLFDKLLSEADDLEQEMSSKGLINFAMTAYHLREWVKLGEYPVAMKSAAEKLSDLSEFQACRDIANGSKHFQITRYQPTTASVESEQGWGLGRFGCGSFGEGEEEITVTMTDGQSWDSVQLINKVVDMWGSLFTVHGFWPRNQPLE